MSFMLAALALVAGGETVEAISEELTIVRRPGSDPFATVEVRNQCRTGVAGTERFVVETPLGPATVEWTTRGGCFPDGVPDTLSVIPPAGSVAVPFLVETYEDGQVYRIDLIEFRGL